VRCARWRSGHREETACKRLALEREVPGWKAGLEKIEVEEQIFADLGDAHAGGVHDKGHGAILWPGQSVEERAVQGPGRFRGSPRGRVMAAGGQKEKI